MRMVIKSSIGGAVPVIVETASAAVEDWSPFFRTLPDPWAKTREEMYDTRGASIGHPWPMYDETQEAIIYRGVKSNILGYDVGDDDVLRWERDGERERLHPSLTDPGDVDFVFEVDADGVCTIGTKVPHARRHHYGEGEAGPDWLPPDWRVDPIQRHLIDPGDPFIDAVAEGVAVWLGNIATQTGERVTVGVKTADVLPLLGR